MQALLSKNLKEHRRIIFNGNGYSREWEEEAGKRGLLNLRNTAEALPYFQLDKNIEVFRRHGIFTSRELLSRMEIAQENYKKIITIEARTMVDMAKKQIYPAVNAYIAELCGVADGKTAYGADVTGDKALISRLSAGNAQLFAAVSELEDTLREGERHSLAEEGAKFCAYRILPVMERLRAAADDLERDTAKDYWPMPTYADLFFSVE